MNSCFKRFWRCPISKNIAPSTRKWLRTACCISYVKWKERQGEELFYSKNHWKCLIPMLKFVRKVHHKNWTFQWQKVYENVIHWIVASNALARFCIVMYIENKYKVTLHSYVSSYLHLKDFEWKQDYTIS